MKNQPLLVAKLGILNFSSSLEQKSIIFCNHHIRTSFRSTLREKCPNTEFFLVRIFPHSDWIDTDTFYAVWLWRPLLWGDQPYTYISKQILSCYGSVPLILGFLGRDGGLSTLCHNCRFACQQTVLNIYILYIYMYVCIYI